MPIKQRFNVCAAKSYERNGEQKKQWVRVGRAVEWDDGNIQIELDTVPVGNWFDGRLSLFVEDGQRQAQSTRSDDVPL